AAQLQPPLLERRPLALQRFGPPPHLLALRGQFLLALLQLLLLLPPLVAPALPQALAQLRQPLPLARGGLGLRAHGGAVLFEGGAAGLDFVLEFEETAAAVVEVSGELGFLFLQSAAPLLEA